jgi:hypothetical protein
MMMESQVKIPKGEEKITVELTVKELIALSGGVRFNGQPDLVLDARKKLKHTLEETMANQNVH